jgi:hypothetical protein
MGCGRGSKLGFKDFKRGLWGWHHSKMQEASRVERLWLAMAVAQLWTVSQRKNSAKLHVVRYFPPHISLVASANGRRPSHRNAG